MSAFKPEISEIEQTLADFLTSHCAVKWYQQVRFETSFCEFFLDMGCLVKPGRAIGIECDGKEFHRDHVREFCRDALILGTGRLACVYHIEAWAIRKRLIDWLRILAVVEPDLFTARHHEIFAGLGAGYDLKLQRTLADRYTGFMFRRRPEMESVKRFLRFARVNDHLSFYQLVDRARLINFEGRPRQSN